MRTDSTIVSIYPDTSGTQSFIEQESGTGNSSIEGEYIVGELDIITLFGEVAKLKYQISEVEKEARRNEPQLDNRLLQMQMIAEKIISEKGISEGKIIAATYNGDLVAQADTMTALLKEIDKINQEDIFIWKAGSDHVDSW